MCHPFRRFCFILAEKLGKSLSEIMHMDSAEIMEWMAYVTTCNQDWVKSYEDNQKLDIAKKQSAKNKALLLFSGLQNM